MKKSAVIAGDPWFGSTTYSIFNGLMKQDWDLLNINQANYINVCKSFAMKVVNKLTQKIAIDEYNRDLLQFVDISKPDAFIVVKGNYIKAETLRNIQQLGVLTVNYYPDYHFSYKSIDKRILNYFDYIFTTKSFQLEYLKKEYPSVTIKYLPHGYSDDAHIPPDNSHKLYENDLLYIGSYNIEKKIWLDEVKKAFPERRLTIYGDSWVDKVRGTKLEESVIGKAIYGHNYSRVINSSKINLAIHMGSVDNTGWKDLYQQELLKYQLVKVLCYILIIKKLEIFLSRKKKLTFFHHLMIYLTKLKLI